MMVLLHWSRYYRITHSVVKFVSLRIYERQKWVFSISIWVQNFHVLRLSEPSNTKQSPDLGEPSTVRADLTMLDRFAYCIPPAGLKVSASVNGIRIGQFLRHANDLTTVVTQPLWDPEGCLTPKGGWQTPWREQDNLSVFDTDYRVRFSYIKPSQGQIARTAPRLTAAELIDSPMHTLYMITAMFTAHADNRPGGFSTGNSHSCNTLSYT